MSPIFPSWDRPRLNNAYRPRAKPSSPEPEHPGNVVRCELCRAPAYAGSPLCFFFVSFFCFRAAGLNRDLILRAPPKYSQVQMNTTAKLKKIYAHMMPAQMLAEVPRKIVCC
jgi:hypothetical protein